MLGVNPAAIKKKKKGEVSMATANIGESPVVKTKEQEEEEVLKSAGPSSLPGIKSKGPAVNKQPEAELELDLIIQGAKKKKEPESKVQDSYTQDLGYFTSGSNGKGELNSGEARARYLRSLKKLKK